MLNRRASWQAAQTQLHDIERWCRSVPERLAGFSYQQKRVALDALGVRVKVWPAEHRPRWEAEARIPLANASNTPDARLLRARQLIVDA